MNHNVIFKCMEVCESPAGDQAWSTAFDRLELGSQQGVTHALLFMHLFITPALCITMHRHLRCRVFAEPSDQQHSWEGDAQGAFMSGGNIE